MIILRLFKAACQVLPEPFHSRGIDNFTGLVYPLCKGVNMGQKMNMLNKVDNNLVSNYKDMGIKNHISTKLDFTINVAGTDFDDIEEAITYAYRCGLAQTSSEQSKKSREGGRVDQDELYKVLRKGQSKEHKADFLREIAKEWFPIELHSEKKIKTVHIELKELADYLEK
jgi:hypothetical protein